MIKRLKNFIDMEEDDDMSNSEDYGEEMSDEVNIENEKEVEDLKNVSMQEEEEEVKITKEKPIKANKNAKTVVMYSCDICNKTIPTKLDFNQHMQSKRHQSKLKSVTKQEIRECKSFKKFLIKKGFITSRRNTLNKMRYFLYVNSINEMLK